MQNQCARETIAKEGVILAITDRTKVVRLTARTWIRATETRAYLFERLQQNIGSHLWVGVIPGKGLLTAELN